MKINSKDFRTREGDEVNPKKWPTIVDPVYKSKKQYQKLLEEHVAELSSQQQLLYASNRHAVLLIFARVHPEILLGEGIPEGPTTTKRSGTIVIVRSRILRNTFTPTTLASSNSSYTSRKRSNGSAFWRVSTSRRRTGSSAMQTLRSGNSGSNT